VALAAPTLAFRRAQAERIIKVHDIVVGVDIEVFASPEAKRILGQESTGIRVVVSGAVIR
jgi:hypothetical protein